MNVAIKVENLSKAYQLGDTSATISTRIDIGTISRDLERYWAKIRGKEDPFLRIGENNKKNHLLLTKKQNLVNICLTNNSQR